MFSLAILICIEYDAFLNNTLLKEQKEYFGSCMCFSVGKEPPIVDIRKPRNINT